jgi:Ni/Fe-hydrogenase subunit HybB-like protein
MMMRWAGIAGASRVTSITIASPPASAAIVFRWILGHWWRVFGWIFVRLLRILPTGVLPVVKLIRRITVIELGVPLVARFR